MSNALRTNFDKYQRIPTDMAVYVINWLLPLKQSELDYQK